MAGRVDGLDYGRSAFSLTWIKGTKPRKGGQDLKFFSLRSGEGKCTIFGARNIKVMQGSRAKADVIAKLEEGGKY